MDEGEKLSANQRPNLDTLLNENEDIFQAGGGKREFLEKKLYEIIQDGIIEEPYVIDEMVAEIGRKILRPPPYHCNLNPIEMVGAQVKEYLAANKKLPEV
ncbi:hypothetical protein Trydic_g4047 [Trypoxylus dichotomus]